MRNLKSNISFGDRVMVDYVLLSGTEGVGNKEMETSQLPPISC